MIRFAAHEDLDNHIIRGLRHRLFAIDIVRAQDVSLRGAADDDILAWAASSGRDIAGRAMSTHR